MMPGSTIAAGRDLKFFADTARTGPLLLTQVSLVLVRATFRSHVTGIFQT